MYKNNRASSNYIGLVDQHFVYSEYPIKVLENGYCRTISLTEFVHQQQKLLKEVMLFIVRTTITSNSGKITIDKILTCPS